MKRWKVYIHINDKISMFYTKNYTKSTVFNEKLISISRSSLPYKLLYAEEITEEEKLKVRKKFLNHNKIYRRKSVYK